MIDQPATSVIDMSYGSGMFTMNGSYNYAANVNIEAFSILGVAASPSNISIADTPTTSFTYNSTTQVVTLSCQIPLTADVIIHLG